MHCSVTSKSIPGGWREQRVTVGTRIFELVVPADPDEFLNQLEVANGEHEVDPYWAALWPTASIMAALVRNHDWPPRIEVLELGCGSGLVGLAALAAGLQVTFSDFVPTAVELALENARRNGLTRARGRILDWNDAPHLQFPLVLGSDLVYDTDHHSALLNTIDNTLARDGLCWLGDPGRSTAEPFCEAARARDYLLQLFDAAGQPVQELEPGEFRLLALRRREATKTLEPGRRST